MQTPDMVAKAYIRISNHIHNTPLLYSETLNKMIGSDVYFKMDAMQKTGSFKLRGVLNHLLALGEDGKIPNKIVTMPKDSKIKASCLFKSKCPWI